MPQALSLSENDVRVWHARTDDAWASPARLAHALAWLSPAEHTRYARFRRDEDREMFVLGRAMARTVVARVLGIAADWPWREGPRGRPELARPGPRPISFNLAHSHGLVVCAVSYAGDVGTDVECRYRAAVDRQLVRRYCAPAEADDIERHGAAGWQDRFLRYWTLKEAYLKARGLGLALPLAELCFTLADDRVRLDFLGSLADADTNWTFALEQLHGSHYVAVAVSSASAPVFRFEPLPLEWLP